MYFSIGISTILLLSLVLIEIDILDLFVVSYL